ncbi:nuclease homologue [Devosia lucknowensis]|uniref:Nuclease homologue n=1 Tax=Devosia lucknowensis TaxID=1096929 RepID=A0A1Y6F5W6_9HYPH|nr:thermonuclease family protein [Devosia lucknowensis]SMQ69959.1 nuclease homologue [Devosia lucknowensis]
MNTNTRAYWQKHARRQRLQTLLARLSIVPTAMVAVMLGALGVMALQDTTAGQWLENVRMPDMLVAAAPQTSVAQDWSRSFGLCSGSVRVTCVVDGDTFWLDGTKYRIADINTPETGSPQCAHEAQLGRRATERLTQLLNAGVFSLASIDRDEDQYGRKLRIVERDGRSLGQQLVSEGLAHEWRGRREGWC